jgi:hypothetical protein
MDHQVDDDTLFHFGVQIVGVALWVALMAALLYWGVLP